jgi:CsoR family transcriptional regulator, copper-sensing transcriptional repressor
MTEPLKLDAKHRLQKIAGQVSGLQRMVDAERPCLEVLQQLASVKSALEQVSVQFLSEHLQTCVLHSGRFAEEGCCGGLTEAEQSEEIKTALRRFPRHSKSS